jgi:hypothetical protein
VLSFKISCSVANKEDCRAGGDFLGLKGMNMFGNPQWFRPKAIGFGLVPKSWQGWAYSAGWGGAIGLPFLLMLGRHQSLEASLWLMLSLGAMAFDVWQIFRSLRGTKAATGTCPQPAADKQVLYIVDSDQARRGCDCRVAVRR